MFRDRGWHEAKDLAPRHAFSVHTKVLSKGMRFGTRGGSMKHRNLHQGMNFSFTPRHDSNYPHVVSTWSPIKGVLTNDRLA